MAPDIILRMLEAYARARANLLRNDADYPTVEDLMAKVKAGLPLYGMQAVGEGQDSSGSNSIVEELR